MKFNSLAMRIWVTFTVIILVIVCALTLLYTIVFRAVDESAKTQDLLIMHEAILNDNYSIQFDTFQNLRGSDTFIYLSDEGEIKSIGKQPSPGADKPTPPNLFPSTKERNTLRAELAKFATSGANETVFKEKINGVNFVFIISEYEDGFLISSVPCLYDNNIIIYFFIIGAIFILIGFVASNIVANYISKPLKELETFTERIAVKDFSTPIEFKNNDEIGRLAKSMNTMQESLKRADEEEKQFLQSISHDLKTPVMVIMSHADAIIDGVYVDSLENTADIIKDEAVSLNKKIRELLYYNTLDYVLDNQTETSDVEVSEIVQNILQRFYHIRNDITFNVDAKKAVITANPEKLTVALENVIDNAVRYAKSHIDVTVKYDDKKTLINIFNDGENIKRLDKIFDSMYKDKTGNFGLGLAITKKIVEFYHGSITAENSDGGVNFKIEFK